jgi:hypothetical protein
MVSNEGNKYLLTYLLTELSPSWGAANCAVPQELPSILWNSKVQWVINTNYINDASDSRLNCYHSDTNLLPSCSLSKKLIFSKVNCSSARLLWNSKLHNNSLVDTILSQINQVCILTLYTPNTNFNIILLSTPKSSKWSLMQSLRSKSFKPSSSLSFLSQIKPILFSSIRGP